MEFSELISQRHSTRTYSAEKIQDTTIQKIIAQASTAPSSRNKKPVILIPVTDERTIHELSQAKAAGSDFAKNASAIILVAADSSKSDVWIEDASIAATYVHLAATDAGLGSCWIQLRNRKSSDGQDSAQYAKKILDLSEEVHVLCMVALGIRE